ncbi:MAG TPA: hypothetical protein VIJ31_01430 [Acidothermaceae bacterium]
MPIGAQRHLATDDAVTTENAARYRRPENDIIGEVREQPLEIVVVPLGAPAGREYVRVGRRHGDTLWHEAGRPQSDISVA